MASATAKSPIEKLVDAIKEDNVSEVKDAIEHGVDVKTVYRGFPFLHIAVYHNSLSVAEFLIRAGVDINRKSKNGSTALQFALHQGRTDMANLLYENGAETTNRNRERLGIHNLRNFLSATETDTGNAYVNNRPVTPPPRTAPVAMTARNRKTRIDNTNAELRVVMKPKATAYLDGIDLSSYANKVDIIPPGSEFGKHVLPLIAYESSPEHRMCSKIGTEYIHASIRECDFFLYYVLKDRPSTILGFATLKFKWNDLYDSEMLYIDLICTNSRSYSGVGTLIMNVLRAIATYAGMHVISLNSVEESEGFYSKMGYAYNARAPFSRNTVSMTLRMGRKARKARKTRRRQRHN